MRLSRIHVDIWEQNIWGVKRVRAGTSLVVQWLRLCAPDAEAQVPFLVGELGHTCANKISHVAVKIHCRQIIKKKKEYIGQKIF